MKTNVFTNRLLNASVLSILLSLTSSLSLATGKGSDGGASKPMFDRELDDEMIRERQELERQKKELLDQTMKARIASDAEKMAAKINSGEFKNELIELLQDSSFRDSVKAGPAKNLLEQMLNGGLVDDIKNTDYVISQECFDEARVEKFLSTKIGVRRSPICVSPRKFYEDYYSNKKIYEVEGGKGNLKVVLIAPLLQPMTIPFWQIAGMFLHDHARQFGEILDDNHHFAVKMAVAIFEYPRFESLAQIPQKNKSGDEKETTWINYLIIGGKWKQSEIIVTVSVPENSRCAGISDKWRSVLDKFDRKMTNNSLVQTFPLSDVEGRFGLDCVNTIPLFWSLFGIEEAEVTVKTISGRILKTFTAKGGYYWMSGKVHIQPLRADINGKTY